MGTRYFKLKVIVVLLLTCLAASTIDARQHGQKKIIYFSQGYWGPIFDPGSRRACKNQGYELEPMLRLHAEAAKLGYDLRTVKFEKNRVTEMDGGRLKPFKAFIVFDCFPNQLKVLQRYPRNKLNLILWEPPSAHQGNYDPDIHQRFSKVYTWRDDLVDNQEYFKIFYPVLAEGMDYGLPFSQKKLAVLIATNKYSEDPDEQYSERRKVVEFYERMLTEESALYGRYWDETLNSYQGIAENKKQTLSEFKFCYCYENMRNIEGYVSEKIFNCFEAGCVPIYWGASNILEFIPAGCFIDRRSFKDDEELFNYISSMDEAAYSTYLKNIEDYLKSDLAKLYSYDQFVETMLKLITGQKK